MNSKTVTVDIGSLKDVTLRFDFVTYKKFEQLTNGKFFMNWFGELQNAAIKFAREIAKVKAKSELTKKEAKEATPEEIIERIFSTTDLDVFGVLRHTSMADFSAFVYAAAHEFDDHEKPYWPISQDQLDLNLDLPAYEALLPMILKGARDNGPRIVKDEEEPGPTNHSPAKRQKTGGGESSGSAESVLASLPKRQKR